MSLITYEKTCELDCNGFLTEVTVTGRIWYDNGDFGFGPNKSAESFSHDGFIKIELHDNGGIIDITDKELADQIYDFFEEEFDAQELAEDTL